MFEESVPQLLVVKMYREENEFVNHCSMYEYKAL